MIHDNAVGAQLSVREGVVVATTREQAPAATLVTIFAGHVTTGGTLSTTVTVYEHVAVLPDPSVKTYETVETPVLKFRVPT
jgi:hypothetical protein